MQKLSIGVMRNRVLQNGYNYFRPSSAEVQCSSVGRYVPFSYRPIISLWGGRGFLI